MTTSSGDDDPTRALASPAARTRSIRIDPHAEARRQAFRLMLAQTGLTPTALARRAGFPSPNLIYNFLHGHSSSLSSRTLARIGEALPHVDVTRLIWPDRSAIDTAMLDHDAEPHQAADRPPRDGEVVITPATSEVTMAIEAMPVAEIIRCLRRLQAEVIYLTRLVTNGGHGASRDTVFSSGSRQHPDQTNLRD